MAGLLARQAWRALATASPGRPGGLLAASDWTGTSTRAAITTTAAAATAAAAAAAAAAATTTATTTTTTTGGGGGGAPRRQRVVVLGSGWAGYAVARTLNPSTSTRILISPRSHFVFTPLLASTSVGTLEFRAAIEPVRRLGLADFHQAWASDIDFGRKVVRVEAAAGDDAGAVTTVGGAAGAAKGAAKGAEFEVPYDKLVLAVGCYSQTFGIEGVREHACFLRDVGDARIIRLRVLGAFEKAALPTTTDAERRKLLHFAVVGGGPTGIEFAAELHDLVSEDLSRLFPALRPFVAITVYDIAPKVLPMFDQSLASYATEMFRRQGIEVKTEHHLQRIRRDGDHLMLRIKEEPDEVGAGVVVWSTGLMQNPLTARLGEVEGLGRIAKHPHTGGIVTDDHMRVQLEPAGVAAGTATTTTTLPDVYAVGDCTAVQGAAYPATAQVASQQAVYLARQLNRGTADSPSAPPFKFRNLGAMAYLGSWRAILQSNKDEVKGRAAWVLWRTAYLTMSMSVRNKIMIPIYWLITWIFGRDISRF